MPAAHEKAMVYIAYIAKVISNAARLNNPLSPLEHALASSCLSDSLEVLDGEGTDVKITRRPICQMPTILRLIGRESEIFMQLYAQCAAEGAEISQVGLREGEETTKLIAVDFDDEPVNTLVQMVREMHRFQYSVKHYDVQSAAVAFGLQKEVLRDLKQKGYAIA